MMKCRNGAGRSIPWYSYMLLAVFETALSANANGIEVTPDAPSEGRWTVSAPAYRMVINLESPRVESFESGGYTLIQEGAGLAPTINTGAPWGPAKATAVLATPTFAYIVLHGMRWEKDLVGEIELHMFCYPSRAVARLDIVPRATPPPLYLGWVGAVKQAAPFPVGDSKPDWHALFVEDGALGPAAVLLPPLLKGVAGRRGAHVRIDRGATVNAHYIFNSHEIGTRSTSVTLLAAEDEASLLEQLEAERAARRMTFDVSNGRFAGYDNSSGLYRFVIKPNVDTMKIRIPSVSVAGVHEIYVAVSALTPAQAKVSAGDDDSEALWLPRDFDSAPTEGPGAHVFRVELRSEPVAVQLRRLPDGG